MKFFQLKFVLIAVISLLWLPQLQGCAASLSTDGSNTSNHEKILKRKSPRQHQESQANFAAGLNSEAEAYLDSPAEDYASPQVSMAKSASSPASRSLSVGGAGNNESFEGQQPPSEEGVNQDNPNPSKRMVEYTAHLNLRANAPFTVLDSAESLVKQFSGFVESRQHYSMRIRVKRDQFQLLLSKLSLIGELVSQAVSAADISDAYTEVKLRLELLEKTRDRYQKLLLKTTDEKTQIDLLQEIKRLSENIEVQNAQLKQLEQRAEYSTIQLNVETIPPVMPMTKFNRYKGFEWVQELDPLVSQKNYPGKYLELETPQSFVQLQDEKNKKRFHLVSAEGVWIKAKILPNCPKGDTQFWSESIQNFLAESYKNHQIKKIGNFQFVRLESHGNPPYLYYIGVQSCSKKIKIIEMYFPKIEFEERYLASLSQIIEKGRK